MRDDELEGIARSVREVGVVSASAALLLASIVLVELVRRVLLLEAGRAGPR